MPSTRTLMKPRCWRSRNARPGFCSAWLARREPWRARFSRKFASGSEENEFGELDITKGAPDSAKELLSMVPPDYEIVVNGID